MNGPDGQTDWPEQNQVDDHQNRNADHRVAIHVALHPVIRCAGAVTLHGFVVLGFGPIQLRTFPQHFLQAEYLWAMRIIRCFTLGVVLTVNGGPLLGDHTGGEPQPETEEMRHGRMQLQRTVRRVAMQVNGDARDRDVRHDQGVHDITPPGQINESVQHVGMLLNW